MDRDEQKRRAAERAVDAVEDGDVVGLGSGSTAACAIRALGRQVEQGLSVQGVPTSFQAREIALEANVPVVDLDQVERIDVAIDGADQVVTGTVPVTLVKGGGGAHAREKLVDAAAERFLVVIDPSKLSNSVDHPVPVEVLPEARTVVAERVRELGGDPKLRRAAEKSGPVVTDNGNLLLDCAFGTVTDPATLAAELSALPGALEHGLFIGLADEIYVGRRDQVELLSTE